MSDPLPNQSEAPLFTINPTHPNVLWLIATLEGREWTTAAQICVLAGKPGTDHNKRWVRVLADRSEGQVAGGQSGYKLVRSMTAGEYNHYRNWMMRQADAMRARVIESDRVFYSRTPTS